MTILVVILIFLTSGHCYNTMVYSHRKSINVINNFEQCIASSTPLQSIPVYISSLSRDFYDVVCVDRFVLDDIRLLHKMDSASRYSTLYITPTASMADSILTFHASWVEEFWPARYLHCEQPFNPLEPKNGVIQTIFIKLKSANDSAHIRLLARQATIISNDLYGTDT